jgi:hypothetical protein
VDYSQIITIEPGKRSGKPCIRGLRITVYDVLDYMASGRRFWLTSPTSLKPTSAPAWLLRQRPKADSKSSRCETPV